MASTYSTNLKIELQATGENSGTWGTITNTNLGTALEQAIVGYGNPSYASDANLTLTYTDTNAAQAARALVLNVTSAVSLTNTRELIVPTIQKQYIVQNNTTGSQSITVKTSAGTGITVPNGRKAHLYVDGTNVIFMDDYVDINGGSIDGTPVGANSASTGSFTTLDTSSTVTVNGGTANQVQYLNASKQLVGSTNLTFDGTTLTGNTLVSTNQATIDGMAVGQGAGNVASNTAVGASALAANTTGSDNVAVGNLAFSLNSTGQNSVAVGSCAACANTTGGGNTAVGLSALRANQTSSNNTAVGCIALTSATGAGNTAVGSRALSCNTSAANNTSIGFCSLFANTTGADNTAGGTLAAAATTTGGCNTALGSCALRCNVTGGQSVAVGFQALFSSTGGSNTALGYQAGLNQTTGDGNTYVGRLAAGVSAGITGINNTALGNRSMQDVTSGGCNTAVGWSSLAGVTTGAQNTGVGLSALCSVATASNNTAVGFCALTANTVADNTAVGALAGCAISTGTCNTAVGSAALRCTTTGVCNTAFGHNTLLTNSTGSCNVALGNFALVCSTTADANVAVGTGASRSNTTGINNTTVGHLAAFSNTTSSSNTAIGTCALYSSTGSSNTAIGSGAAQNNTTGCNNVVVGGALASNSTGNFLVAVGSGALNCNTTANCNTAVGYLALQQNTIGTVNTAIGAVAGRFLTSGVNALGAIVGGSGYVDGTYSAVQLTYSSGSTAITYPTADITVSGGAVTAVTLVTRGTGFKDTTTVMSAAAASLGGTGAGFTVAVSTLLSAAGNTAVGFLALGSQTTASNNTAVGQSAGACNTTGTLDAFGFNALLNNTTGSTNAAFGQCALRSNTTGTRNTAIGCCALFTNSTGCFNIGIGDRAGLATSTGCANIFIGPQTGACNTTGTNNVFIGAADTGLSRTPGWCNTTGTSNVAVGSRALITATASGNTALGDLTLNSTSSGACNTAVGFNALPANSTASNNVAVGASASACNTTGTGITSLGFEAGFSNSTSNHNTAIGFCALRANTATDNVVLGSFAGNATTTGACNTAVGSCALRCNTTSANSTAVGYGALFNSTGASNTGLGNLAGACVTSGASNTFVGASAGCAVTTGGCNTVLGRYNGNQCGLDIRTASCYIVLSDGAGNPRQVIDNNGNVGIGTTSPLSLLDVSGTAPVLTLNDSRASATWSAGTALGKLDFYTSDITGIGAHSVASIGVVAGGSNTASPDGVLVFSTGAYNTVATEKMRIDSSGRVGINTTPGTGSGLLSLAYNSTTLYSTAGSWPGSADAAFSGTYAINASATTGAFAGNTLVVRNGTSVYQAAGMSAVSVAGSGYSPTLNFWAQDGASTFATRMTIDSSGNLLVGSTAANAKWYNASTYTAQFQVEKSFTGGATASQYLRAGFITNVNDANGSYLGLAKSRGTTDASYTIVADGDSIGTITFQGADGSEFVQAASISAAVDGTPGANDMPGRLVFNTTADGAATPTERMRITSAGELLVGGTTPLASTEGVISLQRTDNPASLRLFRNDTSIVTNNGFGTIAWYGNDTTSNTPTLHAYISADASGDHAAGDNPTDIVFATTPDGSATFAEAGRITQAGSYVLKGGTTTAAAGVGIIFPATQVASANANSLDDYEEGTWSPSLGGNATYTVQSGTYTKIGRQVTATAKITVNVLGTGSTTTISGLPFTNSNTDFIGSAYWHTSAVSLVYLTAAVNPSGTTVDFYGATAATGTLTQQAFFQNGTICIFTVTYFV